MTEPTPIIMPSSVRAVLDPLVETASIQAVPQHGVTHVSPVASLVVS
ncbi:hypothetical protein HN911_04555 [Candidatus Bathyarchaeota archaeon]|nr:hypothetical protein [Candidatus Bathyarchaeota archaeon]